MLARINDSREPNRSGRWRAGKPGKARRRTKRTGRLTYGQIKLSIFIEMGRFAPEIMSGAFLWGLIATPRMFPSNFRRSRASTEKRRRLEMRLSGYIVPGCDYHWKWQSKPIPGVNSRMPLKPWKAASSGREIPWPCEHLSWITNFSSLIRCAFENFFNFS